MPLAHLSEKWKGKQKQYVRQAAQGQGGADGIVLPLDMAGDGVYQM
jgi:hypothetical protein